MLKESVQEISGLVPDRVRIWGGGIIPLPHRCRSYKAVSFVPASKPNKIV